VALGPFRSCLRFVPRLSVTTVLPSIFPSTTCFKKAVPTQDMTNPVTLPLVTACKIFLSYVSV
jgi:hypothetical protein